MTAPLRFLRTASLGLAVGILLPGSAAIPASPPAPTRAAAPDGLADTLDAYLTKLYPADAPGAAVIAARDDRTVFRKAYGMADLELGVPLQPDMVFRIGSMTKQFTAVAILMLAEEGTLEVSDPITRFLPDYPTRGKTITIEHLLTHTSGIKSYTDMPDFRANIRKDYTVGELIDLFKDQPMDFEPGERYQYDNSGYFLLGAIIEKASGMGYEAFLQKRIFEVVGMPRTSVESTSRITPRRARGYAKTGDTWVNADWMSMTQPYAAGAIVSTVDDLARWDAALYTGRLVRPETLARAFTPHRLKDGTTIEYGYGWQPGRWEGFTVLQHGGGINGFLSMGVRVPERKVYVAVLSNRTAEPVPFPVAQRLATHLLGKPWEPKRVSIDETTLRAYAGLFRDGQDEKRTWTVVVEGGRLYTQSSHGARTEALPLVESEFYYESSLDRLRFERDAEGRATALVRTGFGGEPKRYLRAAEGPKARREVPLSSEQLERCVGRYELAPGFLLEVTQEGGHLFSQATGQPKVEIFAESQTEFFLKAVDAQLSFRLDGTGPAKGLVLHQGGRDVAAKRLE
jgi:CubicO group peptidase (beta-lactamase class C family)